MTLPHTALTCSLPEPKSNYGGYQEGLDACCGYSLRCVCKNLENVGGSEAQITQYKTYRQLKTNSNRIFYILKYETKFQRPECGKEFL